MVINLPTRTDRRVESEQELRDSGFTSSPSGADKVQFIAALRPETAGGFPSVGARGCFESHLLALRESERRGDEVLLILEDDAAFNPEFRQFDAQLVEQLNSQPWDLVQLGYSSPSGAPLTLPGEGFRLVEFRDECIGAHAYLVSAGVRPRLIEFLEKLRAGVPGDDVGGPMPVDGAYNVASRTRVLTRYLVAPTLCNQRSSASDITPRWFDKISWAKPWIAQTRKVRRRLLDRRDPANSATVLAP
jgi:GR25 family glycosyltransferase involved in LPS biosynthesis